LREGSFWTRAALIGVTLAGGIAFADEPADKLIQDRVAKFREIGTADKHIRDELKSSKPDMTTIRSSADVIKNYGADMLHWFPAGSEPPPDPPKSWLDTILGWFSSGDLAVLPGEMKSHAKPVIWAQWSRFKEAHDKFMPEANRMAEVADHGDAAAVSSQYRKLGESCKACHDAFREKLK
jgi:cytochrome c556